MLARNFGNSRFLLKEDASQEAVHGCDGPRSTDFTPHLLRIEFYRIGNVRSHLLHVF
jgi:hypothetical protein